MWWRWRWSEKKMQFLLAVPILLMASIAGCLGDDEGESNDGNTIQLNGVEYTAEDIFSDFTTMKITVQDGTAYEGVSLKEILEDAGVNDLTSSEYMISAADGFEKDVTHYDINGGILVEENLMTVFPELPKRYRIKDVASIEPVDADVITVNGRPYTWTQPFNILTVVEMNDTEGNSMEGVILSDLVNETGLSDPSVHNYTISADDYEKEVTWEDMQRGILVDSGDHESHFPHLSKKYQVKGIIEIKVV